MKAAVYNGPLDVRVKEVPEPGPLGQDEVLLAPLVGSLCRTDVTEFVTGPKMIPLHHAHPVSEHKGWWFWAMSLLASSRRLGLP